MSTNVENFPSRKQLSASPSDNASSSGGDAKAARKVKKPVVRTMKDDDEDTTVHEKKKKSARAGSSTKPQFRPEKTKDAKPARKSKPPRKEDPDMSSEESGSSSDTTARRRHEQAEKSPGAHTTSQLTSLRTDPLDHAILAIDRGNLDDFQKLVPGHFPVDSLSSQGRSLLDIAKHKKQQHIVAYINQQLTGRVIKAIEATDVDALKKLVPAQVQPDAVSRNGRSLLKIARYKQQQLAEIINYLESQTGEDVLLSRGWIEEDFGKNAYAVRTKAAGKKVRTIEFYDKHGDYYEFTNFYPGKRIELDGMSWKTAEHYFQAQKFDRDFVYLISKVWDQDTAREAYAVAASNKAHWRPDWHAVKVDVMRKTLAAKFGQDEDLRKTLCATGNAQLVEASPIDAFWGFGPDGKGKNMLGKLLMELRTELQKEM